MAELKPMVCDKCKLATQNVMGMHVVMGGESDGSEDEIWCDKCYINVNIAAMNG